MFFAGTSQGLLAASPTPKLRSTVLTTFPVASVTANSSFVLDGTISYCYTAWRPDVGQIAEAFMQLASRVAPILLTCSRSRAYSGSFFSS